MYERVRFVGVVRILRRTGIGRFANVEVATDGLQNEIYDIGTQILYETCFSHNSTQKAPKEELLVRILTKFCVDSESAIKTCLFFNVHATLDSPRPLYLTLGLKFYTKLV